MVGEPCLKRSSGGRPAGVRSDLHAAGRLPPRSRARWPPPPKGGWPSGERAVNTRPANREGLRLLFRHVVAAFARREVARCSKSQACEWCCGSRVDGFAVSAGVAGFDVVLGLHAEGFFSRQISSVRCAWASAMAFRGRLLELVKKPRRKWFAALLIDVPSAEPFSHCGPNLRCCHFTKQLYLCALDNGLLPFGLHCFISVGGRSWWTSSRSLLVSRCSRYHAVVLSLAWPRSWLTMRRSFVWS